MTAEVRVHIHPLVVNSVNIVLRSMQKVMCKRLCGNDNQWRLGWAVRVPS